MPAVGRDGGTSPIGEKPAETGTEGSDRQMKAETARLGGPQN